MLPGHQVSLSQSFEGLEMPERPSGGSRGAGRAPGKAGSQEEGRAGGAQVRISVNEPNAPRPASTRQQELCVLLEVTRQAQLSAPPAWKV